jgi:hypothetical protein
MKAFPNTRLMQQAVSFDNEEGMDLRDYFAAHFLANKWCVGMSQQKTAEEAYKVADAMMKAREQ